MVNYNSNTGGSYILSSGGGSTYDDYRQPIQYIQSTVVKALPAAGKTRDERIKARTEAISVLADEISDLKARPDEPKSTTIVFTRTFNGGKKYNYAARRVNGKWYVTGASSPQALIWDDLLDWLGDDLTSMSAVAKLEKVK